MYGTGSNRNFDRNDDKRSEINCDEIIDKHSATH